MLSCASTKPQTPPESSSSIFGQKIENSITIYALIKKTDDDNYRIEGYSTRSGHIRLNDLRPQFSTKNASCFTNLGWADTPNKNNEPACDSDKYFFRRSVQTAGDVTSNVVTGYFSVITGIITAGAVAGASYSTSFDNEEYQRFIEKNLPYAKRKEIFDMVTVASNTLSERHVALTKSLEAHYDKVALSPNFIDKTRLLPKDAVKVTLRKDIQAGNKISLTWTSKNDFMNQFKSELDSLVSKFILRVECELDYKFAITTTGCEQWSDLDERTKFYDPTITVNSVNRGRLKLTPTYSNNDIEIITLDKESLRIINKTSSFLIVDSISLYVDNEVRNIENLKMEIPPESYIKQPFPLSRFSGFSSLINLKNVDENMLQATVTYGLAVKYRHIDTDRPNTLYKKTTEKISNILVL